MRKRSSFSIIMRMLALVKPLSGWMGVAILCGTLGHISAIAIPVLGAIAIMTAMGLFHYSLKILFFALIGCGILRGVFACYEQQRNHYIAFKLLALIRDKVFGALRRLCPAKLEGKNRGNLISIITSDVELLEVFYAHTISPFFIAVLVSVCMIIFMLQFHWIFAVTAGIAYVITGIVLPILMSPQAQRLHAMQRDEFGNLSSYYLDSLRGLKDIQQMDCGDRRLSGILEKTKQIEGMVSEVSEHTGNINAWSDTLVLGFSAVILCESFFLMPKGEFSSILLPVVGMMSSFGPVLALSRLSGGLSRTLAAGERVLDLLDEAPEVFENQEGEKPDFEGAQIESLNFAYDNEEILKDISVEFKKNQIVGLYGKSGSGKSTLLKLLMRFWNAPSNTVKISQLDVGKIQTSHLRKLESFMTQESDLFQATIEENIKIGNLSASREDVIKAAKKASLHNFIMSLPQGYETEVGELGDTLSGGERQRIGLARVFLHNAPFMLLDEPTSNLDSLNEGVILKALGEEMKNKTIVLVSHRKSTLSMADKTYEVESGRVS